MTNSIKGPALFLAQFLGDEAPFNSLADIVEWARSHDLMREDAERERISGVSASFS